MGVISRRAPRVGAKAVCNFHSPPRLDVRACVRACMRACSKTCARFVSKSDARRLLIVCVCMRRRLPRRAMQHVRLVRRRAVERCIGGEGWHRCFVRVKASPFLASVLCAVLAVLTVVYSVRLRAAFVVS